MTLKHSILVVSLLSITVSLHAMQEDKRDLVVLNIDSNLKNHVYVDRSTLNTTLEKFRLVGEKEPYALVLLKWVSGRSVSSHVPKLLEHSVRYIEVLKEYGLIQSHNIVDETIKKIAREAIVVTATFVEVSKPIRFDEIERVRRNAVTGPRPRLSISEQETRSGVGADRSGAITQIITSFENSENTTVI